ncbi:MAG TPA: hypothetical protein VFN56_04800 [Candidatus Saccharimonadales bacterium]|nr:hypothetical protein [Candidatus Saccharimonadales bacterium]
MLALTRKLGRDGFALVITGIILAIFTTLIGAGYFKSQVQQDSCSGSTNINTPHPLLGMFSLGIAIIDIVVPLGILRFQHKGYKIFALTTLVLSIPLIFVIFLLFGLRNSNFCIPG